MQFKAEVLGTESHRFVRLAGRLDHDQAQEVERLFAENPTTARLDLTDLMSADDRGLEVLGLLQSRGVRLAGASPYLVLQLDSWRARRSKTAAGSVAEAHTRHRIHGETRNTEDR